MSIWIFIVIGIICLVLIVIMHAQYIFNELMDGATPFFVLYLISFITCFVFILLFNSYSTEEYHDKVLEKEYIVTKIDSLEQNIRYIKEDKEEIFNNYYIDEVKENKEIKNSKLMKYKDKIKYKYLFIYGNIEKDNYILELPSDVYEKYTYQLNIK